MGKKQSFQGREACHRMNFLYQACHLMLATPNKPNLSISTYYGSLMVGIAKKSVLRIEPSIKRTMCKGCHSLNIPGVSAKTRLIKRSGQIHQKCTTCNTVKRFNLKKGFKIWNEKPECVVEVLTRDIDTSMSVGQADQNEQLLTTSQECQTITAEHERDVKNKEL